MFYVILSLLRIKTYKDRLMKRIIVFLFIYLGLLQANTITVTMEENCPYACTEDANKKGFLVDIVTAAFKKAGYKVEFTSSSSQKQAIKDVRDQKFDAVLGTNPKEAPGLIYPKSVLSYAYDVIIVPTYSKWKRTSADSLNTLILGGQDEYAYNKELSHHFSKYYNDPKKVKLNAGVYAVKNGLIDLRFDKITALAINQVALHYFYFKRKKPFPFKVAHTYQREPLYIGFTPQTYKSKKYAKILHIELKKLRGSKEMRRILRKYGLKKAYIRPVKKKF